MNSKYNSSLEKIEAEIGKLIPKKTNKEWIKNSVGLDSVISEMASDKINEPGLELIYRGGKRWRPLVLLLTAACFKKGEDIALKLTPLVELIHNGTLLIDDIEDKSIERRGGKAIHLIYGDDMAINSGNHLYFLPTTIIDNLNLPDSVKLSMYKSYSSNMRRLHFGQGLDIQWHNDPDYIPTVPEYIQMCKFKTGCLASMSGELGAICAGLTAQSIEEIRIIWEEIGVGFQILDDVKNITTGNPGKLRGDDIVEGKKSLPIILYSATNNNKTLLKMINKAKKLGIKKGNKFVEKAISILEINGAIKESSNIALNMLNSNSKKLNTLLPESKEKELLIELVINFIKKIEN